MAPLVCQAPPHCPSVSPALQPLAHGWRLAALALPSRSVQTGCTSARNAGSGLTASHPLPSTSLQLSSSHQGPGGAVLGSRVKHSSCVAQLQRRRTAAGSRALLAPPAAALPSELLSSLAASPYRDYYAVAFAAVGAVVWVKVFDFLAANGTLEQKLSRKLVHTTTGPLFMLSWILFSAAPAARFLASVVPMLNFARLVSVGTGLLSDPGLVKSVSRSGDRSELLKGPTFYVVTLVAATIFCWRDNPAGLIAVSMMCGGDGLADIVGRRWGGGAKLPYNQSKSWAGSAAMLAGGYIMSYGLIILFCSLGFFSCYPQAALLSCLGAVALAATVVESLPINQYVDDNVSVPLVAAALALLLLPQPAEALALAPGLMAEPTAGAAAATAAVSGMSVGLAA